MDNKRFSVLNIIIMLLLMIIMMMQLYFLISAKRDGFIGKETMGSVLLLLEVMVFVLYLSDYEFRRKSTIKAYKDVSGIQNKRAYYEHLSKIDQARDTYNTGILIFDLNNLKKVNDEYGHKMGDEYIGAFATVLAELHASNIHAYRIGGDEFALIIDKTDELTIHFVLDEIKNKVNKYNESRAIKVSYAYGYEISTLDHYYVVDELVAHADENMYRNKREFKMRCE